MRLMGRPASEAFLSLASVVAVIALLATGCGGPSPDERFFESVCSTALPRAQEMLDIYDDAKLTRAAPGPDARVELLGLTIRGAEVARKFRAEMKALLASDDTDAGTKAEPYLELSASNAFETMAVELRRVRGLPESITLLQSIRGLDRLEFTLIRAVFFMIDARAIAAETEMLGAYEKPDSCGKLDAVGKD
jgi:hypothetical protein